VEVERSSPWAIEKVALQHLTEHRREQKVRGDRAHARGDVRLVDVGGCDDRDAVALG
jgi:hypothetical protein